MCPNKLLMDEYISIVSPCREYLVGSIIVYLNGNDREKRHTRDGDGGGADGVRVGSGGAWEGE